jgi:hypothetical protein
MTRSELMKTPLPGPPLRLNALINQFDDEKKLACSENGKRNKIPGALKGHGNIIGWW